MKPERGGMRWGVCPGCGRTIDRERSADFEYCTMRCRDQHLADLSLHAQHKDAVEVQALLRCYERGGWVPGDD